MKRSLVQLSQEVMAIVGVSLALANGALANPALAPWLTPATGWVATITSIWVPIIFTVITVSVLIVSRYMGDQDGWISSMLNVLVKASLAANALSIVTFFAGLGATPTAAATLEAIMPFLEP